MISSDFILRPDDERTAQETLKAKLPWTRGWRIGVDVMMPNLVQIRNDVFDVYLIATPVNETTCWVCICYKEPKRDLLFPFMKPLPIPGWRRLRPWAMCRMERYIQQSKDMAVIAVQDPVVSGLGANKLIPLDKVNGHYIRLREKLKNEASLENQASAHPEYNSELSVVNFH